MRMPGQTGTQKGRMAQQTTRRRCLIPDIDGAQAQETLRCMATFTILLVASSLFRQISIAAARGFGANPILPTLLSAVCYTALTVVTYLKPQSLLRQNVETFGCIVSVAGVLLLGAGASFTNVAFYTAGLLFVTMVHTWALFLFACRLSALSSIKSAALAVTGGIVLRQFLLPLCRPAQNLVTGAILLSTLTLAASFLLRRHPHVRDLAQASESSLNQLEIMNPLSSLRPPGLLFLGVFVVSLSYYFANEFGVPKLGAGRTAMVVLMLVVLYALLVQQEGQEDRLFSLCVLFIMTGLLLTVILMGKNTFVSHTFMFLGMSCFNVLLWLLVYGIGRRNPMAAMPVFCAMECINTLGRLAGGMLGDVAVSIAETNPQGTYIVIVGLALFFFTFVWLGFQRFSFTGAIRGIEAIRPPVYAMPSGSEANFDEPPKGSQTPSEFDQAFSENSENSIDATTRQERCRLLAEQGNLTPREVEVFELLARGRNASYIMNELNITRNTAKAHTAHIYLKLGIHSHQELLSLIEKY